MCALLYARHAQQRGHTRGQGRKKSLGYSSVCEVSKMGVARFFVRWCGCHQTRELTGWLGGATEQVFGGGFAKIVETRDLLREEKTRGSRIVGCSNHVGKTSAVSRMKRGGRRTFQPPRRVENKREVVAPPSPGAQPPTWPFQVVFASHPSSDLRQRFFVRARGGYAL